MLYLRLVAETGDSSNQDNPLRVTFTLHGITEVTPELDTNV